MLLSMLAAFLVGEVFLKNVVDRPRPFQTYPGAVQLLIQEPASWSFPSGHSAASFAAATVIFAYFRRWGAAALGLAALIAFSRVFLFVHYPTDVLAGAALGALCALGVLAAFHKLALPHLSRWKNSGSGDRPKQPAPAFFAVIFSFRLPAGLSAPGPAGPAARPGPGTRRWRPAPHPPRGR